MDGWRSVSTGSTQGFGEGEGVRAAGKDLTLIGVSDRHVRWDLTLISLSNRHVRLALSRGERVWSWFLF